MSAVPDDAVPPAAPTRDDYLRGRCTHREYYAALVRDGGVRITPTWLVADVRAALAAGDEHLNSIPLRVWDAQIARPVPYALARAFRDRGDYATAAGLVCVAKEAARQAAERAT